MPSALHLRQLINKSSYFVAISIFVKVARRIKEIPVLGLIITFVQ